ncbi:hypothetical protein SEA_GUDMIT_48 [Gordonia phage Gudmit]|nr:hypothetical protein SEA_GUDMIT_48 [Gordonia phage Gudmit]
MNLRIVTEIPPSTPREYELIHQASDTSRAQIASAGRPGIWYVAWPTMSLYEIDARAAIDSYPKFLTNLGLPADTPLGVLAHRICVQHVTHKVAAVGMPALSDLYRKDPEA